MSDGDAWGPRAGSPRFSRAYVDLVVEEMLPAVAASQANYFPAQTGT
jgi:hypothetical protein